MTDLLRVFIRLTSILAFLSGIDFLFYIRPLRDLASLGSGASITGLNTFPIEAALPLVVAGLLWIYSSELSRWIARTTGSPIRMGAKISTVSLAALNAQHAFSASLAYLTGRRISPFEFNLPAVPQMDAANLSRVVIPFALPLILLAAFSAADLFRELDDATLG